MLGGPAVRAAHDVDEGLADHEHVVHGDLLGSTRRRRRIVASSGGSGRPGTVRFGGGSPGKAPWTCEHDDGSGVVAAGRAARTGGRLLGPPGAGGGTPGAP